MRDAFRAGPHSPPPRPPFEPGARCAAGCDIRSSATLRRRPRRDVLAKMQIIHSPFPFGPLTSGLEPVPRQSRPAGGMLSAGPAAEMRRGGMSKLNLGLEIRDFDLERMGFSLSVLELD